MRRIIIEYTYIFFVDGNIVEQDTYSSDEDAIAHAKHIKEKRGGRVSVARFLEWEDEE